MGMFDFGAFDPSMFGGDVGGGMPAPVLPPPQMPPIPPPTPLDPALKPPTPLPPVQALDATNPQAPMPPGPQVSIQPPPAPPPIRPPVSPTSGAPRQADQALGAAIGGTPGSPMDITSDAQKQGVAADKQGSQMDAFGKRLGDTLKGIKAPEPPKPMPLAAPHLLRSPPIRTGGLQQVLAALSPGGMGGLQGLPSTLGAAIRR